MVAKSLVYGCIMLGVLALGCRTTDPDCVLYCEHSGTISGMVTVAGVDTAVAGAEVDVGIPTLGGAYDFSTVANSSGDYQMDLSWPEGYENPPGMVQITILVSKSGFEPVTGESFAFAGGGLRYDVALIPTSASALLIATPPRK